MKPEEFAEMASAVETVGSYLLGAVDIAVRVRSRAVEAGIAPGVADMMAFNTFSMLIGTPSIEMGGEEGGG